MLKRLAPAFFVAAGAMHFVRPRYYESIMPDWLPAHRALVAASGVAEIAGGVGLMLPAPRARRWAARWLIATVAGVFPANIHMAHHPERYPGVPGGRATLYVRLPAQLLFVWWIVVAGRRRSAGRPLGHRHRKRGRIVSERHMRYGERS